MVEFTGRLQEPLSQSVLCESISVSKLMACSIIRSGTICYVKVKVEISPIYKYLYCIALVREDTCPGLLASLCMIASLPPKCCHLVPIFC